MEIIQNAEKISSLEPYFNALTHNRAGRATAFTNAKSVTEKAAGKKVIALPIEATALGNLKIQMEMNSI